MCATTRNRAHLPCLLLAALFVVVSAGCTQSHVLRASGEFERPAHTVRVLLMPPDVALYEITPAGLLEPKADWTAAGEANVHDALARLVRQHHGELVDYKGPQGQVSLLRPQDVQLVKLHEAVGSTILAHKYGDPYYALPTKKGIFDWTLGEGVSSLREGYDADYALFVYFRDSIASPGRVVIIVVGTMFGAEVPGGTQVGFASLVDLHTGDVEWFNLLSSKGGDLRDPDSAYHATAQLLSKLPL
jgi:hypothetical protein